MLSFIELNNASYSISDLYFIVCRLEESIRNSQHLLPKNENNISFLVSFTFAKYKIKLINLNCCIVFDHINLNTNLEEFPNSEGLEWRLETALQDSGEISSLIVTQYSTNSLLVLFIVMAIINNNSF